MNDYHNTARRQPEPRKHRERRYIVGAKLNFDRPIVKFQKFNSEKTPDSAQKLWTINP